MNCLDQCSLRFLRAGLGLMGYQNDMAIGLVQYSQHASQRIEATREQHYWRGRPWLR